MLYMGRLSVFVIFLLLWVLPARAQDPYYTFINKTAGLPSNSVYDLFQDSKGFIWIAGEDGLTRYDGFQFRTYTSAGQTSRAGNSIAEDKMGRIWYRNFDGQIYYEEGDSLHHFDLLEQTVTGPFAVVGDHLFVFNRQGFFVYDIKTFRLIRSQPMETKSVLYHYSNDSVMYVLNGLELYAFTAEGQTLLANDVPAGSLDGAADGKLLVSDKVNASRKCFVLNNGRVEQTIALPPINLLQGASFCGGYYWILTPTGAWAFDKGGNSISKGRPFFADKNISSVMRDRDGNFWIGTLYEGILLVPDLNTQLVTEENFQPGLLLNTKRSLFVGTKNNTIYTFDESRNTLTKRYSGDVRHKIQCMTYHHGAGKLLFAAQAFFITDTFFRDQRRLPFAVKKVVSVDEKYVAFTSSGVTGLMPLRDDVASIWDSLYKARTLSNGDCDFLQGGRGKTLAFDEHNKVIYSGSNVGLYRITHKQISEIKTRDSKIYPISLAHFEGVLYALTPENDLWAISEGVLPVKLQVGEAAERVFHIRRSGNSFFLVTSTGIRQLDKATGRFELVQTRSGVRGDEINDLEERNGKLIIATDRGLIVELNSVGARSGVQPVFYVNKVIVNGRHVPEPVISSLDYDENDIEVDYSVLSFDMTRRYSLQYSINGEPWRSNPNSSRNIKLVALSPGRYHLSFRLVADGGAVYPQRSLHLFVRSPFWLQWWFWLICLAMVGYVTYLFFRWKTRQLQRKNVLMLEKMELEKNLRNSMLTAIRAQMNPHFFYNALNTIQSFIFSDDKRNASTYLSKLSRLTRVVLEMSERESISVEEEVEALSLYLDLEKMRFVHDFDFEIRLSRDLDAGLVRIPSMIVQPYVENAIKHGLLHMKGYKRLLVDFSVADGVLSVLVDDNGIGRERAAEMATTRKEKHTSFSTEANNRRVALLNREREQKIQITYFDKKGADDEPQGTCVTITIPLT
jgi:ligand-binding sensor domain-containing protein/two-component sensor histidine kinase